MRQPAGIRDWLIAALLVEIFCVTYGLFLPGFSKPLSLLYTGSGCLIAYALLWMRPIHKEMPLGLWTFSKSGTRYRWLAMFFTLLVIYRFTHQWIEDNPLFYQDADMLPIIKTMCTRFLNGEWNHVYDPIPEIWGGIHPIYLPAMWMPFSIPLYLQTDIRWLTAGIFWVICSLFIWRYHPQHKRSWLLLLAFFVLVWWLFAEEKAGLVPYTEEGVAVLYYVLLVIAVRYEKPVWIGLAASACVLSRYALVGWLPAILIWYAYQRQWKSLLKMIVTGLCCFILLVWLPFGWKNWIQLVQLPAAYIDFAARVWHDAPHVFLQSPGWAKFFGPGRILLQHNLLVYASLLLPSGTMLLLLFYYRKGVIELHNLPLAVLKFTLVIFYSLIDVPYLYLFYTSAMVSVMAVLYFLLHEED
jgi:hypothetical protein